MSYQQFAHGSKTNQQIMARHLEKREHVSQIILIRQTPVHSTAVIFKLKFSQATTCLIFLLWNQNRTKEDKCSEVTLAKDRNMKRLKVPLIKYLNKKNPNLLLWAMDLWHLFVRSNLVKFLTQARKFKTWLLRLA